jgi:peptidoglycan/LPS O-acetylase OafA/YrhL
MNVGEAPRLVRPVVPPRPARIRLAAVARQGRSLLHGDGKATLPAGSEKYPALTGVRALGASIVFFDHFPLRADSHLTVNVMAFFYALSGFLIFRIYYEQAQLSRAWLSKYFVNRFARIYPVYFLLLTAAVCLQHDLRPWSLLQNYTLTHALFHPSDLIIQPSWSLTVEECFYFLAPVFMLLARRRGFIAAFLPACAMLAAALGIAQLPIRFLHTAGFVLSTTFFGHFMEFFAGIYLALAVMKIEARECIAAQGNRRTMVGLAGVLLLVIAMMIVYGHSPLHMGTVILLNNFLIPFPIVLLYSGLIREQTWLSRLLSSRLAGLLGRSSYSFYLLHTLVIDYVSAPVLLPLIGSRPVCVVLTFIVTWLASIALFLRFEEPVNIFLRRRFRSKEPWVAVHAKLSK